MKVQTSFRLEKDLLEQIQLYSEIEGKPQTDIFSRLISEALENYRVQRAGGAVLTLPNPQFYSHTKETAEAALDLITKFIKEFKKMGINYPLPAFSILSFFEQRLFYDDPEDIEKFKTNALIDSTQGEKIAEDI